MKLTSKQKKLYTPLVIAVTSLLLLAMIWPGNMLIAFSLISVFAVSLGVFMAWNGENIVNAINAWADTDDV